MAPSLAMARTTAPIGSGWLGHRSAPTVRLSTAGRALVGLPRLYLASQLGSWLTNSRHALPPDCMTEVGLKLTTEDVNAVASWLALQPVPANAKAAPALPGPAPMACSAMAK